MIMPTIGQFIVNEEFSYIAARNKLLSSFFRKI